DERISQVLQRGLAGVVDALFPQHHPIRSAAGLPVDGTDPATLAAHTDVGIVHLDLGDHEAGRRVPAREVDRGSLPHQTAAAVTADEVLGSEGRVVGESDIDATIVLGEAEHLEPTPDRNAELVEPTPEDALEVALPEGEQIVVARREVGDVELDVGVPHGRVLLARRDEPFGDAALVEHLDRARVQSARPRAFELAGSAPLDDEDVGSRELELGSQHHPGRTAPSFSKALTFAIAAARIRSRAGASTCCSAATASDTCSLIMSQYSSGDRVRSSTPTSHSVMSCSPACS